MPRLLCLIPFTLALLLTGCIEGDEEIWLERDGSGRMKAVYKMPAFIMAKFGGPEKLKKQLEEAAAADEHVNLARVDHRKEAGRIVFEFEGDFDSLQELCTFPQRRLRDPAAPDQPVEAEALFGETVLEINDLSLSMVRKIDLSTVLPENLLPALRKDEKSNFHYVVHLPVKFATTDAHTTSNDGKTLEWSFLLRDYTDKPMQLYAKAPLPIPWWVWLAGALVIIAFLAILFLAIRRMILMRG